MILKKVLAWLCVVPAHLPTGAHAQPAASFEASCSELRVALTRLGASNDDYVVISVAGKLRGAEHDGALGYMLMCDAPDPQIVCITYEINDYKAGDSVILSGTLNQVDEDHIALDPCLHDPHE
ncbi:hypothetical protein GA830_07585 [Mesorhizobium sp. NBSH29]|uniref:hypothetical protein n=1 Tax=Mesorhizobium sp. NBSH29 TaxID=2654249 RepID=UPI00189678EB|nr:hypothetical protein [Mesorhizobium sp. NBSH29]QPC86612.1 hypothetical protein GA830_07585 [Mesorhizobium sp. NBSH29]